MTEKSYVCWKCGGTTFTVLTTVVSIHLYCTGCEQCFPVLLAKSELRYLATMAPISPQLSPKAF